MNHISPDWGPRRVPPVEPDLLNSAVFVFSEYLEQLAREHVADEEDGEEEGEGRTEPEIETRAVLDLIAEELGTDIATTLNLYLRVTALFRLLAASPSLARLAADDDPGGALSENALVAAARLDVTVTRQGETGTAEFDPRQFREALAAE
jgi:hypothetical protein